MTIRYICKGEKRHTFNGYDEKLMKNLPPNLQAQFPAVLTHRFAVSKTLVKFMRPAFQHGIGPHRLAKMFRVMQTERYDNLQLEYYTTVDHRKQNRTINSFFGADQSILEFPKYNDKKT